MATADINFYFDPVCPFAWMTSKWVRMVQRERDYTVEWRFISLRLLNSHIDYAAHFPPEYEAGHTAGLRLLRVAASVRDQYGRDGVTALYAALGEKIFDSEPVPDEAEAHERRGTTDFVAPILDDLGMGSTHLAALDDDKWDAVIQAETDEALGLTGKDVGTPIIHFRPPEGVAFFGPVISRLPRVEEAAELWDHVIGLAQFPGFAELKRSLRERPQLRALGVSDEDTGVTEDWHGGSRRQKR
ncbi:mycothiol-dependent nitroreductase Rv2466c family protein [Williamsia phyllosphaerae]|uniref:DSBA oxidoreductase n=1 Tax=Williamsia phyllosphaerae TaxID=885042 RepID=A0ABQ1UGD3_9NOCA|nr:DsbA family protein [Williamsia phyllosphaerae]GGF16713.1 DSBA oxidoreductase [Williamsia phyllosphaerae]